MYCLVVKNKKTQYICFAVGPFRTNQDVIDYIAHRAKISNVEDTEYDTVPIFRVGENTFNP